MNVIFWLLSDKHSLPQTDEAKNILPHWHYACVLTADLYRQHKKVLLGAQDQDHAHQLDEWLWQFEANRFIPHNLPGEGPHYGTPVEINWQPSPQRRQCFVNTNNHIPDFYQQLKGITEWHDFVPADDVGKAAARERYKTLKQAGFEITTSPIPDSIV
ncbi:DNA polymerase III subunit chi [Psychrosphaera haliotis]|uniref:DNA polymerase III subunit chi n=1 Tax=Psychrosphaera haliotis TaxID=555083 RepID=A0A6N8F8S4_9GAMM|nr:DNA polymerase III subunit chi [Psychrosphaera haliotis]MDA8621311.1 DNA polymerase III subunit chi [Psychrosphaera sp.]MDB2374280.1 DNA polymerase III subunit chi [Psychrosphaera haliotis]MUH72946.1 DNA polymerase III subunit chi [Psychrosphaera haliotis]